MKKIILLCLFPLMSGLLPIMAWGNTPKFKSAYIIANEGFARRADWFDPEGCPAVQAGQDGAYGNNEINMPKVKTQDSAGLCVPFAISALLDARYCRVNGIKDCRNTLTPDKQCSVLDLARFIYKLDDQELNGTDKYSDEKFARIPFFTGGQEQTGLTRLAAHKSCAKETCASFEKLVGRFNKDRALEEAFYKKLNDIYDDVSEKRKKSQVCDQCSVEAEVAAAKEIEKIGGLQVSSGEIKKALKSPRFDMFLKKLFVPDSCDLAKNRLPIFDPPFQVESYPPEAVSIKFSTMKKRMKTQLCNNNPVLLSSCLDSDAPDSMENCKRVHTMTIAGYKRFCTKQDDPQFGNKCVDMVKVHNSNGKEWQDLYEGGWVMADELLFRSYGDIHALTWISDKKDQ